MRNIWTIASREYKQFFISPVAYAVAFLFLVVLGWIFFSNMLTAITYAAYQSYAPTVQIVISPMVTLFLFFLPAITMGALAQEQRMGTMELLLTAPVKDWELVVGKWLGCFMFVLTLLAVTWVFPIALNAMVEPGIDQGLLLSGYLGLVLMVGAMLAIGVAVSALFSNQLVAFAVNLGIMMIIWFVQAVSTTGSATGGLGDKILTYLNFVDHYVDFYQGLIGVTNIVYYLSVTALALFLGTMFVETRRWR
ncbi:MAG TPA: ABC transporter permease [Anaerolineales bacterium]|nr:ABC transporter permease [Anaerolineales bacterium]